MKASKITKLSIYRDGHSPNTVILFHRVLSDGRWSSRTYGEITPISYASQSRIERLESDGKIKLSMWLMTKIRLVVQLEPVVTL